MSDLLDLLYDDADTNDQWSTKDALREAYTQIRSAILALAKGERVASVTISGKTVQYSAADLPQLRALKAEYENELRGILDIGQNRVFRVKTSKGL